MCRRGRQQLAEVTCQTLNAARRKGRLGAGDGTIPGVLEKPLWATVWVAPSRRPSSRPCTRSRCSEPWFCSTSRPGLPPAEAGPRAGQRRVGWVREEAGTGAPAWSQPSHPVPPTQGLAEYCTLIDSSSSFRAYRAALSEVEPPCIPYL